MSHPVREPAASGASPPPAAAPALDDLVVLCIERIEAAWAAGAEGAAALERVCAEHPAHASRLRTCVAALRATGMLGEAPRPTGGVPEVLGDFRLQAPLGQGGMGIVYAAEQISLGRRVALKLIRPEQLFFGGARERFRREVDAVARLAHPNIIAIHQVGEERGIPFFAMELVPGASLSEVVRKLQDREPAGLRGQDLFDALVAGGDAARDESSEQARIFRSSWVRACLAIVAQVAEALEHAHQRGVFHRDLKPSNILLTPSGRVLLVDFGLAALQGTHRLTQTGSQLGSLPYLPPEQVSGDPSKDVVRSDVYSLGVTLYELLTLRLPFYADSVPATMHAIVEGRSVPPRERNRAIPPDAETVCLSAIDPDPARRYASAGAFARDLANVLELRPIEARRASARLRLVRAAQRHPAWAIGLCAGFLIVVVGPLAFALQQRRARNEIVAAEAKTRAANAELASALAAVRAERDLTAEERERAERHFVKALDAVEMMLTNVGQYRLREIPQMDAVRRDLLQGALRFYQDLAEREPGNLDVRRRELDALQRVADILTQLGRISEAEAAKRDQLVLVDELLASRPGDAELLSKRAGTLDAIASALQRRGQREEALALYEEAIADYEEVRACEPDGVEPLRSLAAIHYNVGVLHKRSQRLREARDNLESALALDAEVARRDRTSFELRYSQALTLMELAIVDGLEGQPDEREQHLRESLRLAESLAGVEVRGTEGAQLHGKVLYELSIFCREQQRARDSERWLGDAAAIFSRLVAEHPEVAFNRTMLGGVQIELAKLLWQTDRRPEALSWHAAGTAEFQALVERHPEIPDYQYNLAEAQGIEALRLLELGDERGACEALERAIANGRVALARAPTHTQLLELARSHRLLLGRALLARGLVDDAAAIAWDLGASAGARAEDLVCAAELYARCAREVESAAALAPAERERAARAHAASAVEMLEKALARGYRAPGDLESDERFAGLAELAPEFARLAGLARR